MRTASLASARSLGVMPGSMPGGMPSGTSAAASASLLDEVDAEDEAERARERARELEREREEERYAACAAAAGAGGGAAKDGGMRPRGIAIRVTSDGAAPSLAASGSASASALASASGEAKRTTVLAHWDGSSSSPPPTAHSPSASFFPSFSGASSSSTGAKPAPSPTSSASGASLATVSSGASGKSNSSGTTAPSSSASTSSTSTASTAPAPRKPPRARPSTAPGPRAASFSSLSGSSSAAAAQQPPTLPLRFADECACAPSSRAPPGGGAHASSDAFRSANASGGACACTCGAADLAGQPLPVRLGLAPPTNDPAARPRWYLCTPPPPPAHPQQAHAGAGAGASTGADKGPPSPTALRGPFSPSSSSSFSAPFASSAAHTQSQGHGHAKKKSASLALASPRAFSAGTGGGGFSTGSGSAAGARRPSAADFELGASYAGFGGLGAGFGGFGAGSAPGARAPAPAVGTEPSAAPAAAAQGQWDPAQYFRYEVLSPSSSSSSSSSSASSAGSAPSAGFGSGSGAGSGAGSGGWGRRVRRWHGYSRERAPWYFSYDPLVLQADALMHAVVRQSLGRLTMFPFGAEKGASEGKGEGAEKAASASADASASAGAGLPARVLDVGCGSGVWVHEAALAWPRTEFIGMDLVPIQTPVEHLSSGCASETAAQRAALHARISWVVSNFLEPWPFPDGSFDFVHLRHIDQGVPEHAWDHVLAEAVRVAAPGAVIEVQTAPWCAFTNPRFIPAADMDAMASGVARAGAGAGGSAASARRASGESAASLRHEDIAAADVTPQGLKRARERERERERDASLFNPAFEPLKYVFAKMDNRRFINPRSASVVPGALLTQDVSQRKQTLTRQFPIRFHPAPLLAPAGGADGERDQQQRPQQQDASAPPDGLDRRYTTAAGQAAALRGSVLDARLHISAAVMRALVVWANAAVRAASTELMWDEAEREKRDELRRRGLTSSAAARYRSEDLDNNVPFIHPWETRADFEHVMAAYNEDLRAHAAIDLLLERSLGWRQGGGSAELGFGFGSGSAAGAIGSDVSGEARSRLVAHRRQRILSRSIPPSPLALSLAQGGARGGAGSSSSEALFSTFHSRGRASSDGRIDSDPRLAPPASSPKHGQEEMLPIFGFREIAVFVQRRSWT